MFHLLLSLICGKLQISLLLQSQLTQYYRELVK